MIICSHQDQVVMVGVILSKIDNRTLLYCFCLLQDTDWLGCGCTRKGQTFIILTLLQQM
jgi:hypothetical protein